MESWTKFQELEGTAGVFDASQTLAEPKFTKIEIKNG